MGRVFTISFQFREQPCTALVSLKNKDDYNLSFVVHFLNKEVENVLPERRLVFSLASGMENPEILNDRRAEDLVLKTTEAISHYLLTHSY